MFSELNFMLNLTQNVAFSTEIRTIEILFLLADRTLSNVILGRFVQPIQTTYSVVWVGDHVALSLFLPLPSPSHSVFSRVSPPHPPPPLVNQHAATSRRGSLDRERESRVIANRFNYTALMHIRSGSTSGAAARTCSWLRTVALRPRPRWL